MLDINLLRTNPELMKEMFPFSELLEGEVNTLIFPNLSAGNIAYNLLQELGAAEAIGPVLLGLEKPVHVLQLGSSIRSIFNMATIAVLDAQRKRNEMAELKDSGAWERLTQLRHN